MHVSPRPSSQVALFALAMLTFSLLFCAAPANSQQYFTPATGGLECSFGACLSTSEIGAGTVNFTSFDTSTDCTGTNSASNSSTADIGTRVLLAGLPLVTIDGNGKWLPSSLTKTLPSPYSGYSGTVTLTSTISADGTVTTQEKFPFTLSDGGTGTDETTETLDLNTGNYQYHEVTVSSFKPSCPTVVTQVNDASGMLPVTPLVATDFQFPTISFVNPAFLKAVALPTPSEVAATDVVNAPEAYGLSADGAAAVAVVFQSLSSNPVTFSLSASNLSKGFGALTSYMPNYLSSPSPGSDTKTQPVSPINAEECSANNSPTFAITPCIFLALLWAPTDIDFISHTPLDADRIALSVKAVQSGSGHAPSISASIQLVPPPLVLVHGMWSNATDAWSNFRRWVAATYPDLRVSTADYGSTSALDFRDPGTQQVLTRSIADAITSDGQNGIATQKVDVFAHSMGGLVTRYFMQNGPPAPFSSSFLVKNQVHQLITVGTPQNGSPFAKFLLKNVDAKLTAAKVPVFDSLCSATKACTLGSVFALVGDPIDTAVTSLQDGLKKTSEKYRSIVGQAPDPSLTGRVLNTILAAYTPGNTVDSILKGPNDTIVPTANQSDGAEDGPVTIPGIVHTSIVCVPDLVPLAGGLCEDSNRETTSSAVWNQAVNWLLGGTSKASTEAEAANYFSSQAYGDTEAEANSSAAGPIFDLSGYKQVDSSNASFSPVSGSALLTGNQTNISASSATKTLLEVLLFQTVVDPSDIPVTYSTQPPFSITFTPARLGLANFTAFAVFTDHTFATETLRYNLQPPGKALSLSLGAPVVNLPVGMNTFVPAEAGFSNGPIEVTALATYVARSEGKKVFSVGQDGTIKTTGDGVDILDVSYGGVSASAQISVGSCTFSIGPYNQLIPVSGGIAKIQVTTEEGCSWTADLGESNWAKLAGATGTGKGEVSVSAGMNSTGAPRRASISLAGHDVAVIQPASACSYSLGSSQIDAPASGASGSISVSTSCPILATSSEPWISAVALSSSVVFRVLPNASGSSRKATIAIGDRSVAVKQSGAGNAIYQH